MTTDDDLPADLELLLKAAGLDPCCYDWSALEAALLQPLFRWRLTAAALDLDPDANPDLEPLQQMAAMPAAVMRLFGAHFSDDVKHGDARTLAQVMLTNVATDYERVKKMLERQTAAIVESRRLLRSALAYHGVKPDLDSAPSKLLAEVIGLANMIKEDEAHGTFPAMKALRKLGFQGEHCTTTDPVEYAERWLADRLKEDEARSALERGRQHSDASCHQLREALGLDGSADWARIVLSTQQAAEELADLRARIGVVAAQRDQLGDQLDQIVGMVGWNSTADAAKDPPDPIEAVRAFVSQTRAGSGGRADSLTTADVGHALWQCCFHPGDKPTEVFEQAAKRAAEWQEIAALLALHKARLDALDPEAPRTLLDVVRCLLGHFDYTVARGTEESDALGEWRRRAETAEALLLQQRELEIVEWEKTNKRKLKAAEAEADRDAAQVVAAARARELRELASWAGLDPHGSADPHLNMLRASTIIEAAKKHRTITGAWRAAYAERWVKVCEVLGILPTQDPPADIAGFIDAHGAGQLFQDTFRVTIDAEVKPGSSTRNKPDLHDVLSWLWKRASTVMGVEALRRPDEVALWTGTVRRAIGLAPEALADDVLQRVRDLAAFASSAAALQACADNPEAAEITVDLSTIDLAEVGGRLVSDMRDLSDARKRLAWWTDLWGRIPQQQRAGLSPGTPIPLARYTMTAHREAAFASPPDKLDETTAVLRFFVMRYGHIASDKVNAMSEAEVIRVAAALRQAVLDDDAEDE